MTSSFVKSLLRLRADFDEGKIKPGKVQQQIKKKLVKQKEDNIKRGEELVQGTVMATLQQLNCTLFDNKAKIQRATSKSRTELTGSGAFTAEVSIFWGEYSRWFAHIHFTVEGNKEISISLLAEDSELSATKEKLRSDEDVRKFLEKHLKLVVLNYGIK